MRWRAIGSWQHLPHQIGADQAHEIAPIARSRMDVVARIEFVGKGVQRVVERAALRAAEIPASPACRRRRRRRGERRPLSLRPPRRRQWRNRRDGAPPRERRSARRSAGNETASINLIVGTGGRHHAGKEIPGRNAAAPFGGAQMHLAAERTQHQRQFGAGVRMRDRSTYRAPAAGLDMPGPWQRHAQPMARRRQVRAMPVTSPGERPPRP